MYPIEWILIKVYKELTEMKADFGGERSSYDPKRYYIADFWVEATNKKGVYQLPSFMDISDVNLEAVYKEYPDARIFLCDEEGRVLEEINRYSKTEEELVKLTHGELIDLGICPTCFNREHDGSVFGDESDTLFYKDQDIECFFPGNPRADGHVCISTIPHYQDMSEAPVWLNEKIIRYVKALMNIIREVYRCERVYMCTMCDGPSNHYHIQLIPRYSFEERGSKNFVKPRKKYIYDAEKFHIVKERILKYASSETR